MHTEPWGMEQLLHMVVEDSWLEQGTRRRLQLHLYDTSRLEIRKIILYFLLKQNSRTQIVNYNKLSNELSKQRESFIK